MVYYSLLLPVLLWRAQKAAKVMEIPPDKKTLDTVLKEALVKYLPPEKQPPPPEPWTWRKGLKRLMWRPDPEDPRGQKPLSKGWIEGPDKPPPVLPKSEEQLVEVAL
eukprot:436113-Pyramimonas_sp.AAC.1